MIVIIPINGLGTRFSAENYTLPKPLINVLGKRMIFWVIDSLKLSFSDTLVIPYSDQLDYFNFRDIVQDQYPNLNINFIPIDRPTKGAAETLLVAIDALGEIDNVPAIVIDCDTFYEDDIIARFKEYPANIVHYFKDTTKDPIYSYVTLKKPTNRVLAIAEKVKISDYASTGAYGFEGIETLVKYCRKLMDHNELMTNGEYYVSAIYKLMIEDNIDVYGREVKKFHCVGTPLQLKIFCETFNQQPRRFCFDLDSTLVTKPRQEGDYSTVEPIEKNINILRYLKAQGHTIIVYTARRMRTHKGNVGAIVADIGKQTIDTLDDFNIPYDELYFGKPWADFYIDDLGVDCNHDIEKAIGYYNTVTKPRDFNAIDIDADVVTKTGNVAGEIFFYKALKDYRGIEPYFPKLISASNDTLKIERIDGVTLSYLMQNNSLPVNVFKKALNALTWIHETKHPHKDAYINHMIYSQFANRISGYDYSKYENGADIAKRVLGLISEYTITRNINPCVVHGDPVFSNILYDRQENIKFIDMRGKLDTTFTVLGDPIYDLAKVYQSLMGYDFILNDRRVVRNAELLECFEEHVMTNYSTTLDNIKKLTGCLYVSLIPLHDNQKCSTYLEIGSKLLED